MAFQSSYLLSVLMQNCFQIGSINLLRLPAPTPYAFALSALDVLFTKEELSTSLLFELKKSDKPGLDHQKVEVLLSKSTLLYSYC